MRPSLRAVITRVRPPSLHCCLLTTPNRRPPGNSLERIMSYLSCEKEVAPVPSGVPPAYWPASGDIRIEDLSARYSITGPIVLDKVNLHIKSGERIGVVGRTGSGECLRLEFRLLRRTDRSTFFHSQASQLWLSPSSGLSLPRAKSLLMARTLARSTWTLFDPRCVVSPFTLSSHADQPHFFFIS